jgi:hypothetical protein
VWRSYLLQEKKIAEILGGQVDPRLEASGVLAKDGFFYVIFDNLADIACLNGQLTPDSGQNRMIQQRHDHQCGFEDIAYDRWSNRYYALIESLRRSGGIFMAKVQEYDENLLYQSEASLDFPLQRPNKGLEGLTCIRRNGQTHLLGLCEGNKCEAGAKGRKPSGGRIQVFCRGQKYWDRVGKIRLPKSLLFEDYSSIAADGDRLAVVSQVNSALWVGTLAPSSWDIADDGITYAFPHNAHGQVIYCTIEAVSWITPNRIVVVSDKAKSKQGKWCRDKAQSIHIFEIPAYS